MRKLIITITSVSLILFAGISIADEYIIKVKPHDSTVGKRKVEGTAYVAACTHNRELYGGFASGNKDLVSASEDTDFNAVLQGTIINTLKNAGFTIQDTPENADIVITDCYFRNIRTGTKQPSAAKTTVSLLSTLVTGIPGENTTTPTAMVDIDATINGNALNFKVYGVSIFHMTRKGGYELSLGNALFHFQYELINQII